MKEIDLLLLREESEHYANTNDEVFGKISKTIIELLDELERKDKALKEIYKGFKDWGLVKGFKSYNELAEIARIGLD